MDVLDAGSTLRRQARDHQCRTGTKVMGINSSAVELIHTDNRSGLAGNGDILSISQFTLYATLDGRRPSFTKALNYNDAKDLYEVFNNELKKYDIIVETGIFGEDMKVNFTNDGPVTIIIDSKVDL